MADTAAPCSRGNWRGGEWLSAAAAAVADRVEWDPASLQRASRQADIGRPGEFPSADRIGLRRPDGGHSGTSARMFAGRRRELARGANCDPRSQTGLTIVKPVTQRSLYRPRGGPASVWLCGGRPAADRFPSYVVERQGLWETHVILHSTARRSAVARRAASADLSCPRRFRYPLETRQILGRARVHRDGGLKMSHGTAGFRPLCFLVPRGRSPQCPG